MNTLMFYIFIFFLNFITLVDAAVVVTGDNQSHDMKTLLEKKRDDYVDPSILKSRSVGEIFYAPIVLLRPGVCSFPFLSLELRQKLMNRDKPRLAKKLPFDEGRAARDKNTPKPVIMGPGHEFLLYADDIHDLLHDKLAGATTMPVKIIEDYSEIHEESEFWKMMVAKDYAYLEDREGNTKLAPNTAEDIKDDPYLANWMLLIPELFHFPKPPHQRVIGSVEYPAGIRIESEVPKFSLYKLTRALYEAGFDDEELMKDPPKEYDIEFLKEMQKRVHKAFYGGDMYGINWIHTFDEQTKFEDVEFLKFPGIKGQVYVMNDLRS